jgi:signal transduction histidine kinase
MRPTLLLVALSFLLLPPLRAQLITHFFDKKEVSHITSAVATLPMEQAANWTIGEVMAHDSLFQYPNLFSFKMGGVDAEARWFKFTVRAAHDHPILIEFAPAVSDSITLFRVLPNGNVDKSEVGQLLSFDKRALYNHNHTLLLRGTETGEPQVYYARTKAFFPMGLKFRIGQHEAFAAEYHCEDLFFGVFYGILLLVSLINFFLYPAQRDIVYFWYGCYLLSLVGLMAFYNSHFHEWFLAHTPQYNRYMAMITNLPAIFAFLFAINFFDRHNYTVLGHIVTKIFVCITIVNFIVGLCGWLDISLIVSHILSIPMLGIGIYLAIKAAWEGVVSAKFYLLGWLAFLLSLVINFLDDAGKLPDWDFFRMVVMTGIMVEAFFITMGQIARVAVLYKSNRANDLKLITELENHQQLVTELNKNLERSVMERTQELKDAFMRVQEKETQLADYAVKLERSNKELTEFAYIVSHDLKAPLRNIGSFVQLLDRKNNKNFDERDHEYMNFILTSVKQASTLIDDLLNYSKLDKDIGAPTTVQLNRIMERIQLTINNALRERRAEIQYHNLPNIQAHASLISMLFQNLILNGIKYNENPVPIVEIGASGIGGKTVFWVRDNGIGIPPQYQQEVFKMFRRLHTSQAYEGTGIGLAFCKRIVSTYGGDIWLESFEGEGTVFLFTLPKAMAANAVVVENEDLMFA